MLIHGEVDCKIPVQKQLIYLNENEKSLFQNQFKYDIIYFQNCNLHLGKPDSGIPIFKNPYDLEY